MDVAPADLFRLTDNWMNVATLAVAALFVLASIALTFLRRTGSTVDAVSITNDALRGASVLPLLFLGATPIFPNLGDIVLDGNEVLLSIGALNGVATVLTDWWRNT